LRHEHPGRDIVQAMTSMWAAGAAFNPLDPTSLIRTFGTLGVLAIVFAETGLLIGFFLPGDSLLFLAGIAASPIAAQVVGVSLPLPVLLIGGPVCAIAGAQVGHLLGARYGRRIFSRQKSRFFKAEYVERAESYLERFGPAKAIILARFIAIIRTVVNPVAGVLGVPSRRFLVYNVIGGVLWVDGVLLAGYICARILGDRVDAATVDRYILPLVALIIVVSLIPVGVEIWRGRQRQLADRNATGDGR
jgi:membrane-associated protein